MGSATLLVWHTIKQLKMINLWHVFQQMAHLGVDSFADYKFDVALRRRGYDFANHRCINYIWRTKHSWWSYGGSYGT